MKVYLRKNRTDDIDAQGLYNSESRTLTVLRGSLVSRTIHYTDKFRGAKTIDNLRKEYVKDRIVIKDVIFKSASTAANFVTGGSTNGLITWKTESGKTLKEAIRDNSES